MDHREPFPCSPKPIPAGSSSFPSCKAGGTTIRIRSRSSGRSPTAASCRSARGSSASRRRRSTICFDTRATSRWRSSKQRPPTRPPQTRSSRHGNAEMLGLEFARTTNGAEIIECDYFTGKEVKRPDFEDRSGFRGDHSSASSPSRCPYLLRQMSALLHGLDALRSRPAARCRSSSRGPAEGSAWTSSSRTRRSAAKKGNRAAFPPAHHAQAAAMQHRRGLESVVVNGNVKAQARAQFFAFALGEKQKRSRLPLEDSNRPTTKSSEPLTAEPYVGVERWRLWLRGSAANEGSSSIVEFSPRTHSLHASDSCVSSSSNSRAEHNLAVVVVRASPSMLTNSPAQSSDRATLFQRRCPRSALAKRRYLSEPPIGERG